MPFQFLRGALGQRFALIVWRVEQRYKHGASGRKTVYEKLLAAKRRILVAIRICFREILSGNRERDLVLKARYLSGETLSALAREFGLTPQRVFQIVNLSN